MLSGFKEKYEYNEKRKGRYEKESTAISRVKK